MGLKDLLEVFVGCFVDLFVSVLGRLVSLREEDGILGDQVFDLELSFFGDTHGLRSSIVGRRLVVCYHVVRVFKVLNRDTQFLLVQL